MTIDIQKLRESRRMHADRDEWREHHENEVAHLRAERDRLVERVGDFDAMERVAAERRERIDTLMKERDEARAAAQSCEDERNAARADVERLEKQLASATKSRDEWRDEYGVDVSRLRKQLADAQHALANARQTQSDFDSAYDAIIRRDQLFARLSSMAPLAPDHGGSLAAVTARVDELVEILAELVRGGAK